MVRRLIYLLYKYISYIPSSYRYKAYLLSQLPRLDIYSHDRSVIVVTNTVYESIKIMEYIVSIDYDTEYAITLTSNIRNNRTTYLRKWYSVDSRMLDSSVIYRWLELSILVNELYLRGLKAPNMSRANNNSMKLKPFINECNGIVDSVFTST